MGQWRLRHRQGLPVVVQVIQVVRVLLLEPNTTPRRVLTVATATRYLDNTPISIPFKIRVVVRVAV